MAETRSNALQKSRKTPDVVASASDESSSVSTRCITAVMVDFPFLNPCWQVVLAGCYFIDV